MYSAIQCMETYLYLFVIVILHFTLPPLSSVIWKMLQWQIVNMNVDKNEVELNRHFPLNKLNLVWFLMVCYCCSTKRFESMWPFYFLHLQFIKHVKP